MEASGPIFDEQDGRPAVRQRLPHARGVPADGDGAEAARSQSPQQIGAPNPSGVRIDEVCERLGVHTGGAPEAHDHRDGGGAAERLALRQVGHVEKGDGVRAGLRAEGWRRRRRGQRHGGGRQHAGKSGRQSAMTTIRMMISRTMMIVVVEITIVEAPPARSF
jgi:hypothetical protein